MASSSRRRSSNSFCSCANSPGNAALIVSGNSGNASAPSASACRRIDLALRPSSRSRLSCNDESKRVSSIVSNTCPLVTRSPSATLICLTMPPSRFCTTCTCDEGMTLPEPFTTSSSTAKYAQTKKLATQASITHTNSCSPRTLRARIASAASTTNPSPAAPC